MRQRNGFTLIELLVVIAIILILAAILFPVFAYAQRVAVRNTCATHMREIAIAIQVYAGDNSGKCVPLSMPSTSYAFPTGPLWPERLRPYLKSDRLLQCPATTSGMASYFDPRLPRTSYGINWRFGNGGAFGGEPARPVAAFRGIVMSMDSPPTPSRTVLLVETQNSVQWLGDASEKPQINGQIQQGGNIAPFGDWGPYFWAVRWLDYPFVPFGHPGGANFVFADSHVKFIRGPRPPYPPPTVDDGPVTRAGYVWW